MYIATLKFMRKKKSSGIPMALLRTTWVHTLAMSCRLNGPVTSRAWPMAQQMTRILARVSSFRSWGGVTSVASPEWTPAFSTCSDTAIQMTSPSAATASTSISCRVQIYHTIINWNFHFNQNCWNNSPIIFTMNMNERQKVYTAQRKVLKSLEYTPRLCMLNSWW